MQAEYPERTWKTILLDGESLMHTEEARAVMREWNLRVLPEWPPNFPDMNPKENHLFVSTACNNASIDMFRIALVFPPSPIHHDAKTMLSKRMNGLGQTRGS